MARALRRGGRPVMELAHGDGIVAPSVGRDWQELDDGTVVWVERRFDPVAGVNEVVHRWRDVDGVARERAHRVRLSTASELRAMLEASGLVPERWAGGLDGRPLNPASTRMVVAASRP